MILDLHNLQTLREIQNLSPTPSSPLDDLINEKREI